MLSYQSDPRLHVVDIDGRLALHARTLSHASVIGRAITLRRIDELLDERLTLVPAVAPRREGGNACPRP